VYPEGNILLEGASGGLAGACQIVVTTPMEITKIRMQMYVPKPGEQVSQMAVLSNLVKEMGLRGMYTGTVSTFMRDVPFSIVYFSLYGICKCAPARPTPSVSSFPTARRSTAGSAARDGPWRGAGGSSSTSRAAFPLGGLAPPRTKWTRRVPHPVLIGHAASLSQGSDSLDRRGRRRRFRVDAARRDQDPHAGHPAAGRRAVQGLAAHGPQTRPTTLPRAPRGFVRGFEEGRREGLLGRGPGPGALRLCLLIPGRGAQLQRIIAEEGGGALFKGVGPRTIIIAPLFGIALMVKETLVNVFHHN